MPHRCPRNLNLEDVVSAIVARDQGMPYHNALEAYGLTPNQFYWGVSQLTLLAQAAKGESRIILERILAFEDRQTELFRMEESFIREQYALVMVSRSLRRRTQLPPGFTLHPKNIEILIYVAMTTDKPDLASPDRGTVVSALSSIKRRNLKAYLRSLGLGGIVHGALSDSCWEALKVFDGTYQSKAGGASLFDLSQPVHLHPWGDATYAPHSYWLNRTHIANAVYHILTENYPKLGSADESEVREEIRNLPTNLDLYAQQVLSGLYNALPPAQFFIPRVLAMFDEGYQQMTGKPSLFRTALPIVSR